MIRLFLMGKFRNGNMSKERIWNRNPYKMAVEVNRIVDMLCIDCEIMSNPWENIQNCTSCIFPMT